MLILKALYLMYIYFSLCSCALVLAVVSVLTLYRLIIGFHRVEITHFPRTIAELVYILNFEIADISKLNAKV